MRETLSIPRICTLQGERREVNPATVYRMQGEIKYAIQHSSIAPEAKRSCINALLHYLSEPQFQHCYALFEQGKIERIIYLLKTKYANKTEINAGAKRKYIQK